jgi:uncharacterized protein
MEIRASGPTYSATDLTGFLACRHLTTLERMAAHKLLKRPFFDDPMLEILRDRGLAHERAYVEHLAAQGRRVVHINKDGEADDTTLAAMRDGADVIVQARLEHGAWAGWVDVLLRVEGESRLGPWRYEPVETKLATETRAATLVQLCLYASLLAERQGVAPEVLRVVVPDRGFEPHVFRLDELGAYFRLAQRMFEAAVEAPLPDSLDDAPTYPEPVAHCEVCPWTGVCEARRRRDDHVSLVAGLHKTQRKELETWGVTTLAGLAAVPVPLTRRPRRGSRAALTRVREQARVQLAARTCGRPVYERLPIEEGHGLAALPEPSPLDVFLDLEGDRLAEHGGFDYLFGYAYRDERGAPQYEAVWALSAEEERRAFEGLVDLVVERRRRDPSMHVYHYAPYEPTAFKRLMGRYGTRADEMDVLLRERVFVDLFAVVRRGVRAGIESYSIKKLEPFYGLAREVDLKKAARERAAMEYAIAKGEAATIPEPVREAVRVYNKDDCLSALGLRDWLEALRAEAEAAGEPVSRPVAPEAEIKEELEARHARIRAVAEALTAGLPAERDREQDARWTLAQLLEWHRREDNASWWEYHRLNEMPADEMVDERDGVAGLRLIDRMEAVGRGSVVDRYKFPPQDTDLEEGDDVFQPGSDKLSRFATVVALDAERRTIDIKKGPSRAEEHPEGLFRHETVVNKEAVESLLRLGELVRDHGLEGAGPHRAARDLLLRMNPRLRNGEALRLPGEDPVASARRAGVALDGGVLAIQGPPGAGKTFTGARMVVDLVRAGMRVGVTAVSHKVIRNLLAEVVRAAAAEGVPLRCLHRAPESSGARRPDGVEEETDSKRAVARILRREFHVVGGTAWVWSKEELAGALDVLVVDEAGQMSLANVLACAQAGTSLVLLGDPQQLEQPQKASHPDGAELSALEYLLEGHDTMPAARGLFLGQTWRLHPSICAFTSEMFYEGKLRPHPSLDRQALGGPTPFAGAGLHFVPVEHDGNCSSAPEEVAAVAAIVASLVAPGVTWTDRHGVSRPLGLDDILIVAPYNAQVADIAERVPGARVGTVDRFQGQEAPVVVYSMTSSSPEDAPHGMEFLFSRHRLNVATSRAQAVCILVGSPRLFEAACRTPEQMRMVSAFCRYLEMASATRAQAPADLVPAL